MNQPDQRIENSQRPRASKTAVLLMATMVICLGILALFANVQRFRRDAIEATAVKSTTPTPQPR